VSKELSAQLTATDSIAAAPAWASTTGIVLAASGLVAVCAHIAIPLFFTPVPLSMAPFAVLLLGLLLRPRMASAALGAYLIEGAAGLPVFAPGALTGMAHLLGPTGGYLIAYPAAAALISYLWRRSGGSFTAALGSAAAGNLAILLCGALWFAALTHGSAQAVLSLAVVPFLAGDGLKIAAAAGLAIGYQRLRRFSR